MVEVDTMIDCGNLAIIFYNAVGMRTALNETLFSAGQDSDSSSLENKEFLVLYNDKYASLGRYNISFTVYLEKYPYRRVEQDSAFFVDIKNPCILETKPSWCPIEYKDPGIEVFFMPAWMEMLTNQEVTIGGANLLY